MRIKRVISLLLAGFVAVAGSGVAMAQRDSSNDQERSGYRSGQPSRSQGNRQPGFQGYAQDESWDTGQSRNESDSYRQQQQQQSSSAVRSNRQDMQAAQQFIERFDENGDRRLSRDELPQRLSQQFSQLDRNNDSRLSVSELQRHARRMMPRAIPVEITYIWVTDAQRGRLDLNDLQQAYQLLQRIDEDNNGRLSRNEVQQRREEVVSHWINALLERNDENNDNALSPREAEGTLLSRSFRQIDRNGDRQISRNELRRVAEQGDQESYVREEREDNRRREEARQRDDRYQRY
jgi:Ca2+-binding EF-hand superfamily protein